MRELLANMHREELSLQLCDKMGWEQVMIERSQMVTRLGSLREARLYATQLFEEKGSLEDTDAIEILTLRDQLLALAERMNTIKCRNEYLSQHLVLRDKATGRSAFPQAQLQRPKRKSSIATYPPKQ